MLTIAKTLDNYAVVSEFGKDEGGKKVLMYPIDSELIDRLAQSENIDCIMRIDADTNAIYRIHVGKRIIKEPKEIMRAARIFGLHDENRANWEFSKRFDPVLGAFKDYC